MTYPSNKKSIKEKQLGLISISQSQNHILKYIKGQLHTKQAVLLFLFSVFSMLNNAQQIFFLVLVLFSQYKKQLTMKLPNAFSV